MTGNLKMMSLALVITMAAAGAAVADERPIGKPLEINGLAIAAVYLQPVKMAPMVPMQEAPDIHLEADVQALEGNKNGFGAGDWVPYLDITYKLEKLGSDWSTIGHFMAMVASDGPHYGENVKLAGPGKYRLTYHFNPPSWNGLFHHTDKETGVADWWKPFEVSWEFIFAGVGKKGSY